VTATQHDLIREDQVRANERRITSRDASSESLVVRVAEAHHRANIGTVFATHALDLKQAEVALPEAVKRVMLVDDLKLGVVDCRAELIHERIVSNGSPTIGGFWSGNLLNVCEVYLIGSAHAKVEEFLVGGVFSIDIHSIYYFRLRSQYGKNFCFRQPHKTKKVKYFFF
jgi:hypothetical protein